MNRTPGRYRCWPLPSARAWPFMSIASMRATSTRCATCWPMRSSSISAPSCTIAGDQVKSYFTQYIAVDRWLVQFGFVDGRPAVLFYLRDDPAHRPVHFALLDWTGNQLINIRDFLFAPYALEGAEVAVAEAD